MGERDDEAPTELARPVDATEASLAWSVDTSPELVDYQRPRRILAVSIAASLALVAGAGAVAIFYLRGGQPTPTQQPAAAPRTTTTTPSIMADETSSAQPAVAAPPPPLRQPPAPATLPTRGGAVHVKAQSGKTVCQITAGDVQCNVAFTRPTPTINGLPASGVSVTSRGAWQWLVGDPGDPDYEELTYDKVYGALGWTITPTNEGTTFMNDATGHGMTVSAEGFQPF